MTFKEQAADGSTLITGGAPYMPADSLLLPPNLRGGRKDSVLDLNTAPEACQPGFWCAAPGSTNGPPNTTGGWVYGWTIQHDSPWITQYAQPFSASSTIYTHAQTWWRRKTTSGWDIWRTLEVVPLTHNNAWTYRITNAPNDGAERTVHDIHSYGVPPANAIWAQVHTSVSAHCAVNAQLTWVLHIRNGDSANNWRRWSYLVHNHANNAFDMGRSWTFNIDVRPHVARGHNLQIALNCANDPGSGGWIDIGAMHSSVTFMGHSGGIYMYG